MGARSMLLRLSKRIVRSIAVLTCGATIVAGQTARQADAGQLVYRANCASCHLPDLSGRNEAPALTGANFMSAWGKRTTTDLLTAIQSTMPPENRGSLGADAYVNLVAFLLAANGASPASQPLNPATGSLISSIATGKMPASLRQALGQASAIQPGTSGPKGLTVTGEVKNYTPVTDDMLRNPDPGDWLMIRRNYQAWSYSPLIEITSKNVRDLRLAWVWAMIEGGASAPTPIVHKGISHT